MFNFLTGYTI